MKRYCLSLKEAEAEGASWTAKEISQQPDVWISVFEQLMQTKNEVLSFIEDAFSQGATRVLLTGAGSSGYVGYIAEGYLRRKLRVYVEARETTDIVASPENYIPRESPLLLVSHARSGDSPESLATVKLVEKMSGGRAFFLNITCNRHGKLAKYAEGKRNFMNIILPDETNDRAFAMTSSFTSMLLVDLLLPLLKESAKAQEIVGKIANEAAHIIEGDSAIVREVAREKYDRAVFLGTGDLKGLSAEAALKTLELTRGAVASVYNTPLGLRHGPRAIIHKGTAVFAFMSNNNYTRRYEVDFLSELASEELRGPIVVFTPSRSTLNGIDRVFTLREDYTGVEDAFLALPYALYAQLLAFYKSLELGLKPDNPYPEGLLSRVVREFKIYDYPPL